MENIKLKLEDELYQKISSVASIGGGCIGNAMKITTEKGAKYFVKMYSSGKIHFCEANGLNELKTANAIRIPRVVKVTDDFLILEFIESAPPVAGFSEKFGRQFAQLHRTKSDLYGYFEDNFIGSTEQINLPQNDNWKEFYFENRLMFQFRLIEKKGYSNSRLNSGIKSIERQIDNILDDSTERPSLLHGDLWGGNYITDQRGNPCLIDPAVYYGNREADLAMTKLFGGFDERFYGAYNEEYQMADGWQERENLYKLYHILNHVNLFGTSYMSQALHLIEYYV
jgi:fructosamine-3-kinase